MLSPAAKDGKRSQPLSSLWGSISSSRTRRLASLFSLASIVLLLVLVSTRPPRYQPHPTTLEGWQVQPQSDDTPYFGSNSRFTSAPASAQQKMQQKTAASARAHQQTPATPARQQAAQAQLLTGPGRPTTDAPMAVLPPFEPTCIADDLERYETWGCPVIFCSLHPSCTIYNTSCCAYLNYRMLSDFHDFLASKCLQDEYLAMFGTGLGAVRNHTIIPWTEDVDVGITPLALQFLELNATRQELWRFGYTVWHHKSKPYPGYWKLCPHRHHPSPHFQAAMAPQHYKWDKLTWRKMAVYLDLWPMWPVADTVTDCRQRTQLDTTAILATPWDDKVRPGRTDSIDPCSYRRADSSTTTTTTTGGSSSASRGAGSGRASSSLLSIDDDPQGSPDLRRWCVLYAVEPFDNSPLPRMAQIGERWFPTAIDQERILPTVYGPGWRTPDPPNHGTWPKIPDGFRVVDALAEKLSLGAWGGMPYSERVRRCKALARERKGGFGW